ncbi:MAG: ADP-glyceromanno-heptose 6-epimerase [Epsilonproteobacteria bacterium]|nr:ADP-glyceromanno-heptose 6-epimerase [Campylobacterota bacterium]
MKKIAVTGAAGFIGSNIAKRLERDNYDVVAADNFYSGTFKNLIDYKGDFFCMDLVSDDLDPFFGSDALFFESAITDTTVTDQEKMLKNNFGAFRRILEFAREEHIKVVYASSAAVYGNIGAPTKENVKLAPLNVYGYSKLCMDQLASYYVRKYGMDIVGLRYFNVYGIGEQHKGKFASMIYQLACRMKEGKSPRIFTDGEQKRDFVSIDDVVEANIRALETENNGVYNVGSGTATTFNRVVEILNDAMGTDLLPEYFSCPYDFFQVHTEAELSESRHLLGYNPNVSIEDGIADYVEQLGFAKAV